MNVDNTDYKPSHLAGSLSVSVMVQALNKQSIVVVYCSFLKSIFASCLLFQVVKLSALCFEYLPLKANPTCTIYDSEVVIECRIPMSSSQCHYNCAVVYY